jgi:hypothetical protein
VFFRKITENNVLKKIMDIQLTGLLINIKLKSLIHLLFISLGLISLNPKCYTGILPLSTGISFPA